jgi:hypothetical protein
MIGDAEVEPLFGSDHWFVAVRKLKFASVLC